MPESFGLPEQAVPAQSQTEEAEPIVDEPSVELVAADPADGSVTHEEEVATVEHMASEQAMGGGSSVQEVVQPTVEEQPMSEPVVQPEVKAPVDLDPLPAPAPAPAPKAPGLEVEVDEVLAFEGKRLSEADHEQEAAAIAELRRVA
jgi:hypothetical protein